MTDQEFREATLTTLENLTKSLNELRERVNKLEKEALA